MKDGEYIRISKMFRNSKTSAPRIVVDGAVELEACVCVYIIITGRPGEEDKLALLIDGRRVHEDLVLAVFHGPVGQADVRVRAVADEVFVAIFDIYAEDINRGGIFGCVAATVFGAVEVEAFEDLLGCCWDG